MPPLILRKQALYFPNSNLLTHRHRAALVSDIKVQFLSVLYTSRVGWLQSCSELFRSGFRWLATTSDEKNTNLWWNTCDLILIRCPKRLMDEKSWGSHPSGTSLSDSTNPFFWPACHWRPLGRPTSWTPNFTSEDFSDWQSQKYWIAYPLSSN